MKQFRVCCWPVCPTNRQETMADHPPMRRLGSLLVSDTSTSEERLKIRPVFLMAKRTRFRGSSPVSRDWWAIEYRLRHPGGRSSRSALGLLGLRGFFIWSKALRSSTYAEITIQIQALMASRGIDFQDLWPQGDLGHSLLTETKKLGRILIRKRRRSTKSESFPWIFPVSLTRKDPRDFKCLLLQSLSHLSWIRSRNLRPLAYSFSQSLVNQDLPASLIG